MLPTVSVLHLDMLSEENGPNNIFKTVEVGDFAAKVEDTQKAMQHTEKNEPKLIIGRP